MDFFFFGEVLLFPFQIRWTMNCPSKTYFSMRATVHLIYSEHEIKDTIDSRRSVEFVSSNIPSTQIYDDYISKLILYAYTCLCCTDFIHKNVITTKRFRQSYEDEQLKSTVHKCSDHHENWFTDTMCRCLYANAFFRGHRSDSWFYWPCLFPDCDILTDCGFIRGDACIAGDA